MGRGQGEGFFALRFYDTMHTYQTQTKPSPTSRFVCIGVRRQPFQLRYSRARLGTQYLETNHGYLTPGSTRAYVRQDTVLDLEREFLHSHRQPNVP